MKILVVGSGGREHALAWKLKQSSRMRELFVAPGNAGTQAIAQNVPIKAGETEKLAEFAEQQGIDLTIVGPDNSLADGIVNIFRKKNLKIFGPTKEAAQLESSKSFARNLMKKYGIPSPKFAVFSDSNIQDAIDYAKQSEKPLVVKADGLALGKGVIVPNSVEETIAGIRKMLEQKAFGESGSTILLEEKMSGIEASYFAVSDGKNAVPLLSAQDHKRVFDNDFGPNTGGMGSFAPSPLVNAEMEQKILDKIIQPTIDAMRKEGNLFEGCLYAGLMIQNNEPRVVEFNARFGDPETQAIMPLMKGDLLELFESAVEKRVLDSELEWKNSSANCVVLASKGYPEKPETGFAIEGLEKAQQMNNAVLFHAGTIQKENAIVSSGGRVLNCVGTGKNLREAIQQSYKIAEQIRFEGMHFRKDIGKKGLILQNLH